MKLKVGYAIATKNGCWQSDQINAFLLLHTVGANLVTLVVDVRCYLQHVLHDGGLVLPRHDALDALGVQILEEQLLLDLLAAQQLLRAVRVQDDGGNRLGARLGKDQPTEKERERRK